MKKYSSFLSIAALLLVTSACQKEYKAPVSNTVEMNGRWWVELFQDSDKDGKITSADNFLASYEDYGMYALITSNTANNSKDSVLVTENPSLPKSSKWPFTFKTPVNISNLTFTANPAGSTNLALSGETVSMVSGKILKNAATTLSGAKVDSIFVEMEFSDDAGSWYILSGHRDTGQPEDQH